MREIERTTTIPDLAAPGVRNAEGGLTNEVLAEFGRAAVDLGTPDRGQGDERTDAVDALANIMHWLRQLGLDPSSCIEAATRHYEAEIDNVEEQAVRILTQAGIDAHLHHSGGGIWVAEARSQTIPGRQVWITDSEGDESGPFLLGVYPSANVEVEAIDHLSGACSEADLVGRVRRGLSESV
jgi:hypothetical protein